jgi:hypothetical protein
MSTLPKHRAESSPSGVLFVKCVLAQSGLLREFCWAMAGRAATFPTAFRHGFLRLCRHTVCTPADAQHAKRAIRRPGLADAGSVSADAMACDRRISARGEGSSQFGYSTPGKWFFPGVGGVFRFRGRPRRSRERSRRTLYSAATSQWSCDPSDA